MKNYALATASMFTQSELFENYMRKKHMLVICGDNDALFTYMQKYLTSLIPRREEMTFELRKSSEVTDSMLVNNPLYLIGTNHSNSILQKLSTGLPIKFSDSGFLFDGKNYTGENDIIKVSFYPNPVNDSLPATCITGNSDSAILIQLDKIIKHSWGYIFWESWGYQVYQNDKRVVLGNFSSDATSLWQIDKKDHWEFDYMGKVIKDEEKIRFIDHKSGLHSKQVDSVLQMINTNLGRTEYECGGPISNKIIFHLYPSTEIKGLMMNNTEQVHVNFETNEVHAVFNNEFKGIYPATECELAVRQILGKPEIAALEKGLAILNKDTWGGKGYRHWASRLLDAKTFPTLNEIIDNESFYYQSPLIMTCAAGMLVEFLNYKLQPDNFHKQYTTLTAQKILGWKTDWLQYISQVKTEEISLKNTTIETPMKGFNFAHEGYQIYNGYGGSTATHAIEKMNTIGTNSISIIPYTGFRDLYKPARFGFSNGAGGENDEAVIHSLYEAKKHGMTVMLKPQVWGWQGWPGDLKMQNEKDWNLFFEYYTDWIMHFAMLAEMYDADIFCAGVEFQIATTTHEEAWRELFHKIRKVYSGKLTYAANWGYEFDNVTFWDQLDYMSINSYYPLSEKENPTDEELVANFEKIIDNLEARQKKFNKPFLITEIGFKSIDFPWLEPHADNDEQNVNQQSQKRCYDAMFQALEDESWINGIYL
ncbi:MAG: glycoside hydrolase family 113, partial [Chitinophagales bacterium]